MPPTRDHNGPRSRRTRSTTAAARRRHWERIYRTRREDELSWHQESPRLSLRVLRELVPLEGRILDAGGGSSTLASDLVRRGYSDVTVVDLSARALARGGRRGGALTRPVRRVRTDLLDRPALGPVDAWHDRAVFHFLVRAGDRAKYVRLLSRTVVPGGLAVIGTFARDGPTVCSGLPVDRYSAAGLAREFAPTFRRIRSLREVHRTPWGTLQPFTYVVLRRTGTAGTERPRARPIPRRARSPAVRKD